MSFFLVRFLQNFSSVSLAPNAQPLDTLPPPEWSGAPGRKGVEKIFPRSHLTIYASVSIMLTVKAVAAYNLHFRVDCGLTCKKPIMLKLYEYCNVED